MTLALTVRYLPLRNRSDALAERWTDVRLFYFVQKDGQMSDFSVPDWMSHT